MRTDLYIESCQPQTFAPTRLRQHPPGSNQRVDARGFLRRRVKMFASLLMALMFLPMAVQGGEMSPSTTNPHEVYPSASSQAQGIIGVALNVSAHRVGDPARLYIRAIHPEGPAAQVGLAHGDEILAVDGIPLIGKTYQQVVRMIRGEIGQSVKLEVKGNRGVREIDVVRVAETALMEKRGLPG